jgi:hypothetical protein
MGILEAKCRFLDQRYRRGESPGRCGADSYERYLIQIASRKGAACWGSQESGGDKLVSELDGQYYSVLSRASSCDITLMTHVAQQQA